MIDTYLVLLAEKNRLLKKTKNLTSKVLIASDMRDIVNTLRIILDKYADRVIKDVDVKEDAKVIRLHELWINFFMSVDDIPIARVNWQKLKEYVEQNLLQQ